MSTNSQVKHVASIPSSATRTERSEQAPKQVPTCKNAAQSEVAPQEQGKASIGLAGDSNVSLEEKAKEHPRAIQTEEKRDPSIKPGTSQNKADEVQNANSLQRDRRLAQACVLNSSGSQVQKNEPSQSKLVIEKVANTSAQHHKEERKGSEKLSGKAMGSESSDKIIPRDESDIQNPEDEQTGLKNEDEKETHSSAEQSDGRGRSASSGEEDSEDLEQKVVGKAKQKADKVQFVSHDIVWAKVRGHSWWPAVIGDIKRELKSRCDLLYEVHFIGDPSRAQISGKHIRPFEDQFLDYAFTPKTRTMIKNAIKVACKRYSRGFAPGQFHARIMDKLEMRRESELQKDRLDSSGSGGRGRGQGRGRGRRRRGRAARFHNVRSDSPSGSAQIEMISHSKRLELMKFYFQDQQVEVKQKVTAEQKSAEPLEAGKGREDKLLHSNQAKDSKKAHFDLNKTSDSSPSDQKLEPQKQQTPKKRGRPANVIHQQSSRFESQPTQQKQLTNSIKDNPSSQIGPDPAKTDLTPREALDLSRLFNQSAKRVTQQVRQPSDNDADVKEKESSSDSAHPSKLSKKLKTAEEPVSMLGKRKRRRRAPVDFPEAPENRQSSQDVKALSREIDAFMTDRKRTISKQKLAQESLTDGQSEKEKIRARKVNQKSTQVNFDSSYGKKMKSRATQFNSLTAVPAQLQEMRGGQATDSDFEIRKLFEQDFNAFQSDRGQPETLDRKLVRLTKAEWNFLKNGRAEMVARRSILANRVTILSASERIIANLDCSAVFKPLFREIITAVKEIKQTESVTMESLKDVDILSTMFYLRDLCFVILEFINNEEARQIIHLVCELISSWKIKKFASLFDAKNDRKAEIRDMLSRTYKSSLTASQRQESQQPQEQSMINQNQAALTNPNGQAEQLRGLVNSVADAQQQRQEISLSQQNPALLIQNLVYQQQLMQQNMHAAIMHSAQSKPLSLALLPNTQPLELNQPAVVKAQGQGQEKVGALEASERPDGSETAALEPNRSGARQRSNDECPKPQQLQDAVAQQHYLLSLAMQQQMSQNGNQLLVQNSNQPQQALQQQITTQCALEPSNQGLFNQQRTGQEEQRTNQLNLKSLVLYGLPSSGQFNAVSYALPPNNLIAFEKANVQQDKSANQDEASVRP